MSTFIFHRKWYGSPSWSGNRRGRMSPTLAFLYAHHCHRAMANKKGNKMSSMEEVKWHCLHLHPHPCSSTVLALGPKRINSEYIAEFAGLWESPGSSETFPIERKGLKCHYEEFHHLGKDSDLNEKPDIPERRVELLGMKNNQRADFDWRRKTVKY